MAQRDAATTTISSTNEPPLVTPRPVQPKRYSTVNISKKFLEKNSQTPSASQPSASAPKSTSRAPSQSSGTQAHSKLVTAKLTAPTTSTTSQGWSRPGSTAPPSSPPPNPSPAPQKPIHPPQRPSLPSKDGPSKPAWASFTTPNARDTSTADFPTAAEVAQGASERRGRQQPPHLDLQQAETTRQREQEAATFRGAHLDPNAHHWDEMEEDDDNFLDGVLEFGDGKQYNIESAGLPEEVPTSEIVSSPTSTHPEPASDVPVSKEERFADDFDRSWPRSKPTVSVPPREVPTSHIVPSPTLGSSDSSRVLFNERSNKLEPYNNGRGGLKKGSLDTPSPTDTRNVQVLHKTASERSRSGGALGSDRTKDKSSPTETRAPRKGSMGPPPLPPQRRSSETRQLPPHMSQPEPQPPATRQTSRDTVRSTLSSSAQESPVAVKPSPALGFEEIEEAKKEYMHTAAERAKQRRLEEEAQREQERERAKQKAAEIEAKIKAVSAASSSRPDPPKAISMPGPHSLTQDGNNQGPPGSSPRPPSIQGTRRPSIQDTSRPSFTRRDSRVGQSPVDTPAEKASSWRLKGSPRPAATPLPESRPSRPHKHVGPAFGKPPPSALDHVEAIENEELEVVDFTQMGEFLGIETTHESEEDREEKTREEVAPMADLGTPPRSPSLSTANDVWKRRTTTHEPEHSHDIHAVASYSLPQPSSVIQRSQPKLQVQREPKMTSLDDAMSRIKGALDGIQEQTKHEKHEPFSRTNARASQHGGSSAAHLSVSTPARPVESPPSTSPQIVKQLSTEPTAPPPLPSHFIAPIPQESLVTVGERPPSPKRAWNVYNVHLPKLSEVLPKIHPKQVSMATRSDPPIRWDILSFEPPVAGLNRRTLSLNDVLFPLPNPKSRIRIRVHLPSPSESRLGPRVRIPLQGTRPGSGVFGKPSIADESDTWRRPSAVVKPVDSLLENQLHTTSRSPPPDLPNQLDPHSAFDAKKSSKLQPRIPDGSGVGFYKSSPVEADRNSVNFIVSSELDPPATSPTIHTPAIGSHLSSRDKRAVSRMFPNGAKTSPQLSEYSVPPLGAAHKAESKSSQDSSDRLPLTPPNPPAAAAPWQRATSLGLTMKDSPSRVPDPELLKAVWSQTSDKPGVPAVNSLEGIADDLSSVPFTIQDVKSEDGETPPPTAPSRMSLHDVTRAFQQVPSSSPPIRPPLSPPKTNSAISRPTASFNTNSHPLPNTVPGRTTYTPFVPTTSSPMHHPSHPVYPQNVSQSPGPGRMTPVYPPHGHVWMPMGAPNGQPQGPPVLRPMASPFTPGSPYPGQMLAYPGQATPPMYHAAPAGMAPPMNGQPNGVQGRAMPMMSPVIGHAPPHMYPASPVMMHAPPVGPSYGPGRPSGPPRPDQHGPPPQFVPQGYPPLGTPPYGHARTGW